MTNTYDIAKILPASGFVIVEPKTLPKEVSGIINPNQNKEVPQWGTVVKVGAPVPTTTMVAIGPEMEGKVGGNLPLPLQCIAKAGDTVIYKKWGGNDVEVGGKTYYFLKFEEIIGVVV